MVGIRRLACSVGWATVSRLTVSSRSIVVRPRVLGSVEHLVHTRLPKVGIHQEDRSPGLGEDDGEVRRRDGLALARGRTRHEEGVQRRIHGGELDVRAQRAVGLGDARTRIEESDER